MRGVGKYQEDQREVSRNAEILAEYEKGQLQKPRVTVRALAAKYGISAQRVHELIKKERARSGQS